MLPGSVVIAGFSSKACKPKISFPDRFPDELSGPHLSLALLSGPGQALLAFLAEAAIGRGR
jgi:hypothetical protein